MIGVFAALDLVLFLRILGSHADPDVFSDRRMGGERRVYAAVKFILYTMVGSLLMLVAILYLYYLNGGTSFDLVEIAPQPGIRAVRISDREELWLFMAFLLAFAIKVPCSLSILASGRARGGSDGRIGHSSPACC